MATLRHPGLLIIKTLFISIVLYQLNGCIAEDDTQNSAENSEYQHIDDASLWQVNPEGEITKAGEPVPIRCANWHGLQGIHPNADDPGDSSTPFGVMELLLGNPWWENTGRSLNQTLNELVEYGINTLRIPIAPETLDTDNELGKGDYLFSAADVKQENARAALENIILKANEKGIAIILSLYTCSNEVGWRAGTLTYDPGIDPGFGGLPDNSCTDNGKNYNKELWLQTLREMAALPQQLNVDNIMGIDIYNEPWGYDWSDWKTLADDAYQAIASVNANPLIFVQGASTEHHSGDPDAETTQPAWSENFFPFSAEPLDIPKNKLVISPHLHGPGTFKAPQYFEARCEGLSDQEAIDNACGFDLQKERLEPGWDEHFGYLRAQNYAVLIGEFGGNLKWPEQSSLADWNGWQHISPGPESDFQNLLIDYMMEKDITGCYWAVNPEASEDDYRGGLYQTPHRAGSNDIGWGIWGDVDEDKRALLYRLWGID